MEFRVTSWEGIKTVTTNLGTILDRITSSHVTNTISQTAEFGWIDSCQNFLFVFVLLKVERREASGKLNLVLTKFI